MSTKEAYRRGQMNMAKTMLGTIAIAIMFTAIFGQAFLF